MKKIISEFTIEGLAFIFLVCFYVIVFPAIITFQDFITVLLLLFVAIGVSVASVAVIYFVTEK